MRRLIGPFFLSSLILCTGCLIGSPPEAVMAPKVADATKALPPITADSVTEANYRTVPQALTEEMDREERQINLK